MTMDAVVGCTVGNARPMRCVRMVSVLQARGVVMEIAIRTRVRIVQAVLLIVPAIVVRCVLREIAALQRPVMI